MAEADLARERLMRYDIREEGRCCIAELLTGCGRLGSQEAGNQKFCMQGCLLKSTLEGFMCGREGGKEAGLGRIH